MSAISITSSALLVSVKMLMPLVPNNPVVPILENLRLTVEGTTLHLAASNLEADLTTSTQLTDGTPDFDICLPAKLLLSTLQNLPSQPITLHLDSNTYSVTLRAGKGRYRLPGENPVSWPTPKTGTPLLQLAVPGITLAQALRNTSPFVVTGDSTRPSLTGVLLDLRGSEVRTVATDGHRMSWTVLPAALADSGNQTGHFIMPQGPARLLATLAATAGRLSLDLGEWLQVAGPDWQLKCRLIDERYPEYENVIPVSNPAGLLIEKSILVSAIKRVLAYAAEKTMQIGLRLQENQPVQLWAESVEYGSEAMEQVEGEYSGEDMEMGLNGKYLLESLQLAPDGMVRFSLSTPNRAALLTAAESTEGQPELNMLLMPVLLASMAPAA